MFYKNYTDFYNENGYLILENFIPKEALDKILAELPQLYSENGPHVVREKNNHLRAIHGSHFTNPLMRQLTEETAIVNLAEEILNDKVYVHQFKINTKLGMEGDVWPWHQDFIFWLKDDGIMEPNLVNVSIFLDEVNEFNAPLYLIPGTHKLGSINVPAREGANDQDYLASLQTDLKYTLDQETIKEQVSLNGIIAAKGGPGTVLLFHSNTFHGSTYNLSPFDRHMLIMTYNSIHNLPKKLGNRPAFLCSPYFDPIEPHRKLIPDYILQN